MRTLRFTFAMVIFSGLFAIAAPSAALAAGNGASSTTTHEHNATDTFTDVVPCVPGNPPYDITITYNEVDHVTMRPDGSFRFTSTQTGSFQAVPANDPSLPTYTGHFTQWDGFSGNAQNATGTFTFTIHGTGSDGSSIDFHETAHFTVNPDGTVTSSFDKASC
jgi:hypothetical protein